MIGPGKAELLERIDETGSIAAAARDMGMSYKRAWSLIETLNAMFDLPLVASTRGGRARAGRF
ncbi:winged helix-turn-helix domain-containing protein [Gemmobacter lanyuensis]